MIDRPTRPVLRWHGGKWRLGPWIMQHLPPHRTYVEPYGGAASVLLRKPRSYAEVYNDLDGDLVNLFRVLRSDRAAELVEAVRLSPFSRAEWRHCYEVAEDPIEEARRLIVRSFMGFGSGAARRDRAGGFRDGTKKQGSTPAADWSKYPDALAQIVGRLNGVVIENRPAIDVMRKHDGLETLHYVDPPYLAETRSPIQGNGDRHTAYRHEMTEAEHAELLSVLRALTGMAVVSGYAAPLYDTALCGWLRVERKATADGGRARTEVLWINPAASAALGSGLQFDQREVA